MKTIKIVLRIILFLAILPIAIPLFVIHVIRLIIVDNIKTIKLKSKK